MIMTYGYAVTTLTGFIVSIFFVTHPVSTPTTPYSPRISINLTTAPILAIALLWAAQCLDHAVIRNGIVGTKDVKPYNVLILFFSLAYMATTLSVTGILQAIAYWVSKRDGGNGWRFYFGVYVMFTLLSIVFGNDAIIHFGTAYLVHHTAVAILDPTPWIMAGFAAANIASMVLFVGNPANVVICEGFGISNAAFTAYTILPFFSCSVVCFIVLAFQYNNKIPVKPGHPIHRDPKLALLDPVGALVGSCILGVTLVLCLVVGYFGIDVWMVSLPFAVGKLLFDLAWDYYRHSHGISMLGRSAPKTVAKEHDPSVKSSNTWKRAPRIKVSSPPLDEETTIQSSPRLLTFQFRKESQHLTTSAEGKVQCLVTRFRSRMDYFHDRLDKRFPTFINALARLPFALLPFAFSQFILIEALDHQGWIDLFARWFVRASGNQLHPTIWLAGILGVVLCNVCGTNIGATILLTKTIRAAALPYDVNRGAAIALAVSSNIGAVGFTFSASFSGLLWQAILGEEGIHFGHADFARRNLAPLLVMTTVGLGIVSAEMAVLF